MKFGQSVPVVVTSYATRAAKSLRATLRRCCWLREVVATQLPQDGVRFRREMSGGDLPSSVCDST